MSTSSQYEQITSPAEMVDIPPQPIEWSSAVFGDRVGIEFIATSCITSITDERCSAIAGQRKR